MPLQIGDNSSEKWRGVKDIRVDGAAVQSVAIPDGTSWVELWRRNPYVFQIVTDSTLVAPSWALYADVILLGGGGGGAGGDGGFSQNGRGGEAGDWRSTTRLVRPGDKLEFTIGLGGYGSQTEKGSGGAGGSTKFKHETYTNVAFGGAGGVGTSRSTIDAKGFDPGRHTFGDWQVTGGRGGSMDESGMTPGGGGGGGSGGTFGRWSPGQPGASGGAWVRYRSA